MPEKGSKISAPLFIVTLYPPMALIGYLVVVSSSFLVYGLTTGIADTTYTFMFLGLIILLLYGLYFIASQRVWRARFYDRMFSVDERRRFRDINYEQIRDVSATKTLFGLVSGAEITLKNERNRLRILGNPRNSILQTDLRSWLLEETKSR